MKFLKQNTHISLLLVFGALFIGYHYITNPGDIDFIEISIEQGDSLWALSEQYRGKMASDEWIDIVKVENKLYDSNIVAGKPLIIPVVGEQPEPIHSIKIARSVE
ncbi:MAG: LysM peptidoglycan-binding domain-containing protein [Lysinibacillus sp.]